MKNCIESTVLIIRRLLNQNLGSIWERLPTIKKGCGFNQEWGCKPLDTVDKVSLLI